MGQQFHNWLWRGLGAGATALGILSLALVFSPSIKLGGWFALAGALVAGLATAANMAIDQTGRLPRTTLALSDITSMASRSRAGFRTGAQGEMSWYLNRGA